LAGRSWRQPPEVMILDSQLDIGKNTFIWDIFKINFNQKADNSGLIER
jgi:hypothetical protein